MDSPSDRHCRYVPPSPLASKRRLICLFMAQHVVELVVWNASILPGGAGEIITRILRYPPQRVTGSIMKYDFRGACIMNDINIPDIALTENTSQRLPCALVLDGSGSMAGAPIDELNAGLRLLEQELKNDDVASQRVQLLVIRFGDNNEVTVLSDWKDAMDFQAPQIHADGVSPLGAAVTVVASPRWVVRVEC